MKIEVCAIMRNEGRYVKEWVAWYRLLGFDQITIYDNQSTDDMPDILQDYQDKGVLTYRYWPDPDVLPPQYTAYWDALSRTTADWLLFVDADEFLVLHRHQNAHDYLANIGVDADCIAINWAVFGSNGETDYRPELLAKRFTRRGNSQHKTNRHLKSFVRPGKITALSIHRSDVQGHTVTGTGEVFEAGSEHPTISATCDLSVAQINHYVLKSREEFNLKKRRGSANRGADDPIKMTRLLIDEERYWKGHDQNRVEDLCLFDRQSDIEAEIDRVDALPPISVLSKLKRWIRHFIARDKLTGSNHFRANYATMPPPGSPIDA